MVAPVGRQGKILEKYYGYARINEIYYPCKHILGQG